MKNQQIQTEDFHISLNFNNSEPQTNIIFEEFTNRNSIIETVNSLQDSSSLDSINKNLTILSPNFDQTTNENNIPSYCSVIKKAKKENRFKPRKSNASFSGWRRDLKESMAH